MLSFANVWRLAQVLLVSCVVSQQAFAEYHISERHHKGSYSITVTDVWPVCPGCACAPSGFACYPNDEQLNNRALGLSGSGVQFSGQPYHKCQFQRLDKRNPSYDQRTADDDVMRDPNMNNQYNMF